MSEIDRRSGNTLGNVERKKFSGMDNTVSLVMAGFVTSVTSSIPTRKASFIVKSVGNKWE